MTHDAEKASQLPLVRARRRPNKLSVSTRWIQALVLCLVCGLALVSAAQAQELSNYTLRLRLNVTPEGIPVIQEAVWRATGQTVFRDLGTPDGLAAWVPDALIPEALTTAPVWSISNDSRSRVRSRRRDAYNLDC
jgi:hypothetical protein